MKLTWKITKKRGNWRPVLTYKMEKEDWEHELMIPGGETNITIPRAERSYQEECLPGEYERKENYTPIEEKISLVSSKDKKTEETFRLPWRPGAKPAYPEVEEAMKLLLQEWERRTLEALDSGTIESEGAVEHSNGFKQRIAPYVAAKKMLE